MAIPVPIRILAAVVVFSAIIGGFQGATAGTIILAVLLWICSVIWLVLTIKVDIATGTIMPNGTIKSSHDHI